jgi:hypothetical protein
MFVALGQQLITCIFFATLVKESCRAARPVGVSENGDVLQRVKEFGLPRYARGGRFSR